MLPFAMAICQSLAGPADAVAAAAPWRIDINIAQSELTEDLPAWRETLLAVGRGFNDGWAATARLEASERFDRNDLYGEVRVDRALGEASSAYLTLGLGPGAEFRPEAAFRFGGAAWVAGSHDARTTLQIDLDWARYSRAGEIQTLKVGVERWFADGRASLNGRWIGLLDDAREKRTGFSIGGSWRTHDRLDLRFIYADAPESDQGLTVEVRTLALGATLEVSDAFSLRAWVTSEERKAYDRSELSLGAAWRL